MPSQTDFIKIMEARGFFYQTSNREGLEAKLAQGIQTAYIGYDATAASIHVGNLMGVMMLHWWQKCGHRPITLMGGGTTKVGDPTGRDDMRSMKTDEEIQANIDSIQRVYARFLKYGDGPSDAIMVNNNDWLSEIKYLDFLRDYGRHFSVNRMLSYDSVRTRLEREQPLSFLEFNYMILQGYDYLELNRRYGTILQMGGSDQWSNILNGVELTRRCDNKEVFAFTSPLLTKSSGEKMGKSRNGAIWLNADMLSPYDYWQFWRNVEDADVGKWLKIYTTLPLEEIAKLEALQGSEINEAKKVLAFEATALAHGREAAEAAAETARMTFEAGAVGEDLPRVVVAVNDLDKGIAVIELLKLAGLSASNGEARRLIEGGGARVNDTSIDDAAKIVSSADMTQDNYIKLSSGKKKHVLIVTK